jgi:hypothetical protein
MPIGRPECFSAGCFIPELNGLHHQGKDPASEEAGYSDSQML